MGIGHYIISDFLIITKYHTRPLVTQPTISAGSTFFIILYFF